MMNYVKRMRSYVSKLAKSCLVLLLLFFPNTSSAGPYKDDLIRCVGDSLTENDKNNFAFFIALSFSRLPEMRDIFFLDEIRKDKIIRDYATSLDRLIILDCRSQSENVVKFEGPNELASAANMMGQIALREKLADPAVVELFDEMEEYVSTDEWNELFGQ